MVIRTYDAVPAVITPLKTAPVLAFNKKAGTGIYELKALFKRHKIKSIKYKSLITLPNFNTPYPLPPLLTPFNKNYLLKL